MGRRRSAEEAGDPGGGERGTAKRARNASPRDLVAAANASRDVVSLVVGTDAPDDASTSTRGYVVDQLPDRLRRWCFDLTKRNMEAMYTRTWGWSNPEKRRELAHSDARFLVAFKHKHPHRNNDDAADDDDDTPIGFVHFRFEVEDSDGSPVAYVYELQVEDEMKGRGVGTALMAAVESIAKHTRNDQDGAHGAQDEQRREFVLRTAWVREGPGHAAGRGVPLRHTDQADGEARVGSFSFCQDF